jgi:hypothetical protein
MTALQPEASFETWQEPSAYAPERTRKPPGVARRLNADGHRTASGAMWTPRLVRFLLALMFNDFGSRKQAGTPTAKQPLHQTCSTSVHAGCFKPAGSIGSFRSRLPVAAKIAFAIAGMIADVPGSPMPPGASLFLTICTSIAGASLIRTTW